MDDELHEVLLELFPEFKFEENLKVIDENAMKSASGKDRWRKFIMPVSRRSWPGHRADVSVREAGDRLQLRNVDQERRREGV